MKYTQDTPETDVTEIWQEYQKGLDYLNSINLFTRIETSYNFVEGNQWEGLESGGERMPILNFLKPVMKYGIAIVAQNGMTINYSSMDYGQDRELTKTVCDQLNRYAAKQWEKLKLDRVTWDVIQDAYIAGDNFLYFYDYGGEVRMESIDTNNIMLADEQNPNIQEQPYILIIQRRYVDDVIAEARENGIDEEDIRLITPDQETDYQVNAKDEVDNEKKCISIMKLWKEDEAIWVARATKTLQYQPNTRIDGLTLYPIAQYTWQRRHGAARGWGDVWDKIPNQIEVNKGLARLCIASKEFSFPHIVYDRDKLSADDIENLSVIGSKIGVNSYNGQKLSDIVGYMQASNINPLAQTMVTDMIQQTRDLAGAGDYVTGQINPEKASGAAIIAVRDASALPLNMQVAAFKQFVEDIALVWYDLWVTYNPNGLLVQDEQGEYMIPPEVLEGLKINVRIDVSPTNPYSKYAQEQGIQNLLTGQFITFEEYVESLDDDSSMPKAKLVEILEKRKLMQMQQMQQVVAENEQMKQQLASVPGQIEQAVNVGMEKQAEQDQKAAELEKLKALAGGAPAGDRTTSGGGEK
jgi:hypothetical protein